MSEIQLNQPEAVEQPTNLITSPYDSDAHFQFVRARLLTHILTVDDKKLIANLIDQSKRVICHIDDLRELIAAFKHIDPSQVAFETRELIVTKWCKTRVLPFKKITKLDILSAEEKNILENLYSISLDTVYEEPFKSI